MDDVLTLAAREQAMRITRGALSAEALMRATLDRIAAVNGALNAVVSLRDADDLLREARTRDAEPPRGPLHGLPVAVKDLANARGLPTSMGSPLLEGQVAGSDDVHVARMRAAGAVIIGKTNTPEFGLGSNTYNPVHGITGNPYDMTLTCGGSSGGAAAALSTRMLGIADGSDMMGSLRNPAGWCNVYGMRPSWGHVPSEPAGDAFLHQLSTNGPMARCPGDLALLLDVMSGPDPRQPHGGAVAPVGTLAGDVSGKRIGWIGDWGGAWPFEPGILPLCEAAALELTAVGCEVEPLDAPFSRDALWESWSTLRSWQVACGLSDLYEDGAKRARLKPAAIWEIERGRALTGLEVHRASTRRSAWFQTAAALFEQYDALVWPTAQVWPFPTTTEWPTEIAGVEMDTYHRWMELMIPASLPGLPAVSVPAGFGPQGLPMGLQIVGRRGDDRGVLEIAEAYHLATDWPGERPPPMS